MNRAVWDLLKEGYGAEDIALRLSEPVAEVRKCIAVFRSQGGKLAAMYTRQKRAWGEECSSPD